MSKTILVTGANGNLGQAVTRKFLDEGYKVIGVIAPGSDPNFIASPKLDIHEVDLIKEEKTFELIGHIEEVEGAILTVGGFGMGKFESTPLDKFEKMLKLNFTTAYNSSRAVFKKLKNKGKGGQIVMVGTRPALEPSAGKGVVAYALSKRLVHYLSDLINEEAKDTQITSSVVVPSMIDTPQNRKAMPDADFEKWVKPQTLADNIYHLFTKSGKALRETVLKVYNQT